MKLLCRAEGDKIYLHDDVNIRNVNFLNIRKPMRVSNNVSGVILNFYGSATYGSYDGINEEFDNIQL